MNITNTRSPLAWTGLLFLWISMLGIFIYALPHLRVDRASEFLYMGVPYRMVAAKQLRVIQGDPFVENGPQAVFVSAAIAYGTHSLAPMRYYHFLFSLIILALFWHYFFKRPETNDMSLVEVFVWSLCLLSVWVTIPLILVYPIQVNGMTPGYICFFLGLLLNRKHPQWAMIAFGFSYSFKGQFLAMLPGILLYKWLFERNDRTLAQQFGYILKAFLLYLAPTALILTSLYWILGMFDTRSDLLAYAFRVPALLYHEFSYIIPVLLHKTTPDPYPAIVRKIEYGGFGFVTWLLIALSVVSCLGYTFYVLCKHFKKETETFHAPFALYALAGIGYWINYFFFWRYPFWYNTLPMIWFDILLIPLLLLRLKEFVELKTRPRWGWIVLILIALFSTRNIYRRLIVKPVFNPAVQGDSLEPYSWMSTPV